MSELLNTQPAYEVTPPESPEHLQMSEDRVEPSRRMIDDTEMAYNAVARRIHESHATPPNHIEAASMVAAEIEKLHNMIPEVDEPDEAGRIENSFLAERKVEYDLTIKQYEETLRFMRELQANESLNTQEEYFGERAERAADIVILEAILGQHALLEQEGSSLEYDTRKDIIRSHAYIELLNTAITDSEFGTTDVTTLEALDMIVPSVAWARIPATEIDTIIRTNVRLDELLSYEDDISTETLKTVAEKIPLQRLSELYAVRPDEPGSSIKELLATPSYDTLERRKKAGVVSAIYQERGGLRSLVEGEDILVDAWRQEFGPDYLARVDVLRELSEQMPSKPENDTPEAQWQFNQLYRDKLKELLHKHGGLSIKLYDSFQNASESRLKPAPLFGEGDLRLYNQHAVMKSVDRSIDVLDAVGADALNRLHDEVGLVNLDRYLPQDINNLRRLIDGDVKFIEHLQAGDVMISAIDTYGDHNGAFDTAYDQVRRRSDRSLMFEIGRSSDLYRHMILLQKAGVKPSTIVVGGHGLPGATHFGMSGAHNNFAYIVDESIRRGERDVDISRANLGRILGDEFMQPSRGIDDPEGRIGEVTVIISSCSSDVEYSQSIPSTAEVVALTATQPDIDETVAVYGASDVNYVTSRGDELYFHDIKDDSIARKVIVEFDQTIPIVKRSELDSIPLRRRG